MGSSSFIQYFCHLIVIGGLFPENDSDNPDFARIQNQPRTSQLNEPAGTVDDVLTFTLLTIAISGGDYKSDCLKWWEKALRLAFFLRLGREDAVCSASGARCENPLCSCSINDKTQSFRDFEAREERRRVFWLLYSLDRHLALSYNAVLRIPDTYPSCLAPLPEPVWQRLNDLPFTELPFRAYGPPITVSGTSFFEFFTPLMAILGDIIELHHRRHHPRLGHLGNTQAITTVSDSLIRCEESIIALASDSIAPENATPASSFGALQDIETSTQQETSPYTWESLQREPLTRSTFVAAYSSHILHVLYVLLHGKWDALSMLEDDDDWITSEHFASCASHAISASEAISRILRVDPEMTFMPYIFGIYLLQGSFVLLLFADRMPQLGPNPSVEQACEIIIRAHEVCVVTLNTEFQVSISRQ